MQKKNQTSDIISRKAWNILRLALLWARKGGVFKRRLAMDLSKFLISLRHFNSNDNGAVGYHYREREFSFDKTPIFRVKMHRPSTLQFRLPRIPCINSQVDFDYDFNDNNNDDDLIYLKNDGEARRSFLRSEGGEEMSVVACEEDDEGIDMKAEEFIAKFYQQMKLQRQISLLSVSSVQ